MGGLAADRPPHQAGQVADRQRGGGWRTTGRGPGDRLRLAERAGLLGLAVEATDPRPYLDQEWFWDVRAFVERLTRAGYAARCPSVAAPLQIEGALPSGMTFYFRAEFRRTLGWDGARLSCPRVAWYRTTDAVPRGAPPTTSRSI